MSVELFDSNGRAYAYSDDGETIYTFSGVPIAYFDKKSVYAFDGRHLGYFENGYIWDEDGSALLVSPKATAGPDKPSMQTETIKKTKKEKPIKNIKDAKPINPIKKLNWSSYTPEQIFEI